MNEEYDEILTRLKEVEDSVKESNHILHSMQRTARLSVIFSALKWVIVIGISLGTFYFAKPYLEQLLDTYNQVSNIGSFFNKEK